MNELFAQVILPLPLHNAYTYRVPLLWHKQIKIGQRVVVQFGAKKIYAALVYSLSDKFSDDIETKDILDILDEEPVILPANLALWEWISEYYACTLGDVFKAALPPGLRLESKSKLIFNASTDVLSLTDKELTIVNSIRDNFSSPDDLHRKLGAEFSFSALKSLLSKNVLKMEEHVNERFKPKMETRVYFHPQIKSEVILQQKIDSLEKARKQQALVLRFCELTGACSHTENKSVSKKQLLNGKEFSSSILKELVAKNILVLLQEEVSRIEVVADGQVSLNFLNPWQKQALEEIKEGFSRKQVTLIHGITASGKTELYIHLIEEVLQKGLQALYLLPEIALTTQIIERLKNVFGSKVGIYHSRLNDHERVEIWNKVLEFSESPEKGYQVILGARSALFLPFSRLGLVVVDEEHENSFKQYDPAPRYHARDMAVLMGKIFNANVLLGSATPSYESYFNTLTGKYKLVRLEKRHSEMEHPEVIVADIKRAYKRKQMHSMLTPELFNLIEEALAKKEQVVLFQNRRGYAPFVQCFSCGEVPKCKYCDVSLTYHKFKKRLNCHYCGYNIAMPAECPECGSSDLKSRGFGTEKVEEELQLLFPHAKIDRMDLDSTRSKHAFGRIIHNVETRKTDILIGTQMVTKGLDFEHVSIAGILNADNLINFPDFRAHERAYQLISQVSGRAGRKYSRGKVVLQTSQPGHPLINLIMNQDYISAFNMQMQERKLFMYPPFNRLIKIIIKHKKSNITDKVADHLAGMLRTTNKITVLGPEYPLVGRIQLWYSKEIWVKVHKNVAPGEVKLFVDRCISMVKKETSSCNIYMDVDPY